MVESQISPETWEHKCTCIFEKSGIAWVIKKRCKKHTPDFQKKADKIMRKRLRKRGRGWTKSDRKKHGKKN